MDHIHRVVEQSTPRGIATAISRLITDGTLAAGSRLPTVRVLAAQLGVSPATVSHAWQALSGVGLIESRGRNGSFVRSVSVDWLPPRFRELVGYSEGSLVDLSRGNPDPRLLPELGPALSRVSQHLPVMSYQEVPVIAELELLLKSNWPYPVEAMTIVNGAMDALSRSLDQIVRYGDRVVVENPGFPPLFDLLDQLGAVRVAADVDEFGMVPASLHDALDQAPVAVVLQTRAHNPTGASMSAERARELAEVLRDHRDGDCTLVVEDDHSGEISVSADVSLGTWLPDRVLHIRSYSKSHGPDLRIAALGGPSRLIDKIVARRILGPGWTSRMLQAILYDLLTHSHSMSQVGEARHIYFARQKALTDALAARGFPTRQGDGVNLWLRVARVDQALVTLSAASIRVASGMPFLATDPAATSPDEQFIRVTAGMVRESFDDVAASLVQAGLCR